MGCLQGLVGHLVEGGLGMLQYVDDTIFLFDGNLEGARNLNFLLCLFEHITGLKINFHKSEIFCLGDTHNHGTELAQIFTCKIFT